MRAQGCDVDWKSQLKNKVGTVRCILHILLVQVTILLYPTSKEPPEPPLSLRCPINVSITLSLSSFKQILKLCTPKSLEFKAFMKGASNG